MAHPAPPDDAAVRSLTDNVQGDVLHPGDDGYEAARTVWNGMVDNYPSYVVRCTSAADVVAAVNFAREHDELVGVKGGGHNFAGKSVPDDGLMIDLSPMDSVTVDPDAKTARVGPGATWGDFDQEAQAYGLATTGGVDSRTGVAGLTLGGGIGWLARSYGLACDNLLSAEVVTAEGEIAHASEKENSDLFWGLRGGGGNFGVVTSFEFELHDVGPELPVVQAFHPFEDAKAVLRHYREFMAEAPDEVSCYAFILHVPPMEPFPEEYHGATAAALVGCYNGDIERGREILEPLASFGDPILAFVDPMPYTALQQSFDDGYPDGERYYGKSSYIEGISDDLIDALVSVTDPLPGPLTGVFFESMGGAVNRVDARATAFPHRDAPFNLSVTCGWMDPAKEDEIIGWAQRFNDEVLEPHSAGGVYVNYLDRDDDDRLDEAFRENYDRLVDLKREWDPQNLFRLNSNIEPNGAD